MKNGECICYVCVKQEYEEILQIFQFYVVFCKEIVVVVFQDVVVVEFIVVVFGWVLLFIGQIWGLLLVGVVRCVDVGLDDGDQFILLNDFGYL